MPLGWQEEGEEGGHCQPQCAGGPQDGQAGSRGGAGPCGSPPLCRAPAATTSAVTFGVSPLPFRHLFFILSSAVVGQESCCSVPVLPQAVNAETLLLYHPLGSLHPPCACEPLGLCRCPAEPSGSHQKGKRKDLDG